jgi:hypothetical protein
MRIADENLLQEAKNLEKLMIEKAINMREKSMMKENSIMKDSMKKDLMIEQSEVFQSFSDIESFEEFSLDLVLSIRSFKKISDKDRSSESLNKRKPFITHDSSDLKNTKEVFKQRVEKRSRTVNQNSKSERARESRRGREQRRKRRRERERERRQKQRREREREREREQIDHEDARDD